MFTNKNEVEWPPNCRITEKSTKISLTLQQANHFLSFFISADLSIYLLLLYIYNIFPFFTIDVCLQSKPASRTIFSSFGVFFYFFMFVGIFFPFLSSYFSFLQLDVCSYIVPTVTDLVSPIKAWCIELINILYGWNIF